MSFHTIRKTLGRAAAAFGVLLLSFLVLGGADAFAASSRPATQSGRKARAAARKKPAGGHHQARSRAKRQSSVKAAPKPTRAAASRGRRGRKGSDRRIVADSVVRTGELFGPPAPQLIAAAYTASPDEDPEMLDEAGNGEAAEPEEDPSRWYSAARSLRTMLLSPVDAVERAVRRGRRSPKVRPTELSDDEVITLLRLRPIVPVDGVERASLNDSFLAPRSPRRIHHAIDIHAPNGTPCLATVDGVIAKLSQHPRGGTGLYLVDGSGRISFYYAHLSAYAPGLAEGTRVRKGDVIGYVGTTGNARGRSPHLHFSVATLEDGSRGRVLRKRATLNPYPILAFVH